MKQKAIVCDVHNTILVPEKNDKPIQNVIDFLNQHSATHKIIIMTASPEREKQNVIEDLRRLNVSFDRLVMNTHDEESDEYKQDAVKSLMSTYDIVLFIDNSKDNRKAVKELGIETKKPENISNKVLTKTVWSGIFI
jgi:hypothetical protein